MRRRLEKRIYIPLPDLIARSALIKLSVRTLKLADDVDIDALAAECDGYSGADISNVCRDAAFVGMRRLLTKVGREAMKSMKKEDIDQPITQSDFLEALQRVQPSVGTADLAKFTQWEKEFGAS